MESLDQKIKGLQKEIADFKKQVFISFSILAIESIERHRNAN
jgi:hypothetical protein